MITRLAPRTRLSRRTLGLIVGGASVSASLLVASPALAAPNTASNTASQSCWENVDTGATGCFDSALDEREQIELATGRPLVAVETGSANASRSATSASPTTASATTADYLLVTGWDGINQTGDSKSYLTSNTTGCGAGLNFGFQNLQTWSDRFESIQSYNGCLTTLYADINFGGAFTGLIATSNDLGTFKNKASSLDVG
ncbi:hypothetical protein SAMN06295879_0302 [Agreia bicolorata]|uniref:Peptidase inhibitor family I36 n=1 Tax=Agreia bicolorata TaxID=110935 RepID=A0A1T4WVV4_9MICO|nr:hypothetical protein [Agreia bicolorata]SKA81257.1 hypothetical protein SAMN06295879_0302 [Agreia bicolorata]